MYLFRSKFNSCTHYIWFALYVLECISFISLPSFFFFSSSSSFLRATFTFCYLQQAHTQQHRQQMTRLATTMIRMIWIRLWNSASSLRVSGITNSSSLVGGSTPHSLFGEVDSGPSRTYVFPDAVLSQTWLAPSERYPQNLTLTPGVKPVTREQWTSSNTLR